MFVPKPLWYILTPTAILRFPNHPNLKITKGVTALEQTKWPQPDEMYCPSCGKVIKKLAELCVHCGVRPAIFATSGEETLDTTEYSPKSRIAAGILGILLGAFGVHRFYLGYVGIGIIQIIATLLTAFIGGIWGIIEGIIIVAGGDWNDSDGKPLKKY